MRIPRVRNGVPKQPIQHLWERQKEIARRLVAGHRQIDIALDFNMTPGRMSIICNSPIFKTYLASLSVRREEKAVDISEKIKEGATLGVQHLVDTLQDEKAHVSLRTKIAMDFLDREGHGKVTKLGVDVVHHLTSDKIAELKAKRAEKLQGITYQPILEAEVIAG